MELLSHSEWSRHDLLCVFWFASSGALDSERSPDDTIRPEVLLILEVKEFGKAKTGAVHPALDGAQLGPANPGNLLVSQALCPREENSLALLRGKLRKSYREVPQVQVSILSGEGREHAGHHAVRVLDLPSSPAHRGVELIA
jgi:hypothetical protein